MATDPIALNITKVLRELSAAAEKYQRDPNGITLMAVSKTQPSEAVRAAATAGLQHFGENYLQEAVAKIAACADLDLCWHYIGPIQSNKTRPIAENFHWVHSVDRDKILRRLSEQRPAGSDALNICLQVNISGEDSKSGVSPDALPDLLETAAGLPGLRLRGLMAIPAPEEGFAEQKAACDKLAELFVQAQRRYPSLDTLSIGMSADMEAAIAAGSTLLRIGTAIFGPRADEATDEPHVYSAASFTSVLSGASVSVFSVAFIGAGNMAGSIISGLLAAGFKAENLAAADPEQGNLERLRKQGVTRLGADNAAIAGSADLVLLAVKPQILRAVCEDLAPIMRPGQLVMSIAAGVSASSLQNWLGTSTTIVRCMPNTPALLGAGASALYAHGSISDAQRSRAEQVMGAVGVLRWVDEEAQLHAVTAVSGSGPAYFFLFMEAMIAEAQRMGLDAETARTLCAQTCIGAGRMVAEGDVDAAELRRRVCSPGGTTERAVAAFQAAGLEASVYEAMRDCYARSEEMGEELS